MKKIQKLILVLLGILAVAIAVTITIYRENNNHDIFNAIYFIFAEMILLFAFLWIYLRRATTVSTRWIMKICVGISLLPMSSMVIIDFALHKYKNVIAYFIFAFFPVLGFAIGDNKASDEVIKKEDQKRKNAAKDKAKKIKEKSN